MAANVTATKKARSRPTAAKRPAPALPALPVPESSPHGFEPLRVSSEDVEPEERAPLFYIDDIPYTVLLNPPAAIGLEVLLIAARDGGSMLAQMAAESYLLTEMLGEDGYAALRRCKSMTLEERKWVAETCSQLALGGLEDPKP